MVEFLVARDFIVLVFYSVLFVLFFVRFRGFSNLVLLVLRDRKISYVDEGMKRFDDEWFDFQLFKIKHGINVCNLRDARIIQQGLLDGELDYSCFSFSGAWGDIAKTATFKQMYPTYLLAYSLLLIGLGSWIAQYKFYLAENSSVEVQFISLIYVIIAVLMILSIRCFKKANKMVLEYYKIKGFRL